MHGTDRPLPERTAPFNPDPQTARLEVAVADLIKYLGDDETREGVKETPRRFVKAMREMCAGYAADIDAILSRRFASDADELIVVHDIAFHSLCEHHLLPFFGTVSIGYIPAGHVLGLSKFARIVDVFARRLQMQETMTSQIGHAIEVGLAPAALGVVVRAKHLCMAARGARSGGASFTTSYVAGRLKDPGSDALRAEFHAAIGHT